MEFPADDPERALRFWGGLLGTELSARDAEQGQGWQSGAIGDRSPAGEDKSPAAVSIGVHERGRGPGDTVSLPYFAVDDIAAALRRVTELGGAVVHPGERWAICRDSEGSPFGLAAIS